MIENIIPAVVPAMPLEKYMKRAWPLVPGRVFRDILKKKDVRVNGVKSDGKASVQGVDVLLIYAEAKWFEPEPDILWTDDENSWNLEVSGTLNLLP